MYWKPIRLYSTSNSKTPHQLSFADRQNGCAKIVPHFLSCIYYLHVKVFSYSKVCPLSLFIEPFIEAVPAQMEPKPFSQDEHLYLLCFNLS